MIRDRYGYIPKYLLNCTPGEERAALDGHVRRARAGHPPPPRGPGHRGGGREHRPRDGAAGRGLRLDPALAARRRRHRKHLQAIQGHYIDVR